MDKIIVSILGAIFIGIIYWFFFGKKETKTTAKGADHSITITVEGGYNPSDIQIPMGKKTTLIFIRKDDNSCLEDLILPDFKIKKFLPMHTPITVILSPTRPGIFDFHCGMNMYHGRIEVVNSKTSS